MNDRLTRLFGVRYPVVQAGMIWCSGWRLAFRDEPSPSDKEADSADGTQSFLYSLGVIVGKDGKVAARFHPDVAPDAPELLGAIDKALAA